MNYFKTLYTKTKNKRMINDKKVKQFNLISQENIKDFK